MRSLSGELRARSYLNAVGDLPHDGRWLDEKEITRERVAER